MSHASCVIQNYSYFENVFRTVHK